MNPFASVLIVVLLVGLVVYMFHTVYQMFKADKAYKMKMKQILNESQAKRAAQLVREDRKSATITVLVRPLPDIARMPPRPNNTGTTTGRVSATQQQKSNKSSDLKYATANLPKTTTDQQATPYDWSYGYYNPRNQEDKKPEAFVGGGGTFDGGGSSGDWSSSSSSSSDNSSSSSSDSSSSSSCDSSSSSGGSCD